MAQSQDTTEKIIDNKFIFLSFIDLLLFTFYDSNYCISIHHYILFFGTCT